MSIQAVFPDRKLTLSPQVELEEFGWLLAGGAFALVMILGPIWLWGGDLVRDSVVGGDYDLLAVGSVDFEGECSGRMFLMNCMLTLWNDEGGERVLRAFWVGLQHPATVTIAPGVAPNGALIVDFMQKALFNRWLSIAVWVGSFAALGAVCAREFVMGRHMRQTLRGMRGARLTPVEVSIEKATLFNNYPTYRYRPLGEKRAFTLTFAQSFDPFAYGLALAAAPADGGPHMAKPLALAVRAEAGGPPILLDRDLTTLDLSSEERAAILGLLVPDGPESA